MKILSHFTAQKILIMNRWLIPLLVILAMILAVAVGWLVLYVPDDYLQGTMVKVMFVHVPSAYLATLCYGAMAMACFIFLVWRLPMAQYVAQSLAVVGLLFVMICLVTGSLWGKPTWGSYWVWDARLTSVFVLFLLYVGQIFLSWELKNYRPVAILAVVGAINLPIIKFSVVWFQTLHQGPSLFVKGGATIDMVFLIPLLGSMALFTLIAMVFFLWNLERHLYKKLLSNNRHQ